MIKDIEIASILKTGPNSRIRDLGRFGYVQFGVPTSSPLDIEAFEWNNHLLKNKPNDAQIEINQPGFEIQFNTATYICLSGAKASISLNGQEIKPFGILQIKARDRFSVGRFHMGSVIYLAVLGGFQTEIFLGSRTMLKGISLTDMMAKGDKLNYFTNVRVFNASSFAHVRWNDFYLNFESIEVYPGPEWDLLDEKNKELFRTETFHISNLKNTMAVQLAELLSNKVPGILTSPVYPGTVQLTSSGKLICLLQDAQVTGGYPRILQVAKSSLRILSQRKPGQAVRFIFREISFV